MDLHSGFEIEDPAIFVPWHISETRLRELVPAVREVTSGYFVLDVVSLGGLRHALGFHFDPRVGGRLVELEFFRRAAIDLGASFADFDERLEAAFGPPVSSGESDLGFPSRRWDVGGTEIVHFVFERFGPEEHVRIRRLAWRTACR